MAGGGNPALASSLGSRFSKKMQEPVRGDMRLFQQMADRCFTPPSGRAKLTEAEEKRMADTRNGGGTANSSARKGKSGSRRKKVVAATAGAAIGIGSAALVAALLYANRPTEDGDQADQPATDPRFEPGEA